MARATPATQPRTPLTKERVLHAAVALAERDGIEAMTMRKLADELGVGAMTLYYHVPNKEQLLDGMVDIVFGEIELPTTDVDWRTAMRRRALSTRAVLNRHRWAVGLMESRLTPGRPASGSTTPSSAASGRPASRSRRRSRPTPSRTPTSTASPSRRRSLPFETAEESAAVAEKQNREYAELAEERQLGELAQEFPHLAEVVAGHVAKVGYDFASAFVYGLDLILDALELRRETP